MLILRFNVPYKEKNTQNSYKEGYKYRIINVIVHILWCICKKQPEVGFILIV